MQISNNGIELIKEFEGCRLKAYKCPAGVWTIGYGHTKNVKENDFITKIQADNYLKNDIKIFEFYVNSYVKFSVNQNQFDALCSFTFNLGLKNLKQLLKNRNKDEAGHAILLYNKAHGKVLKGLARRRQAEYGLYFKN